MSTIHTEVHVAFNERDAELLTLAGLPLITADDLECYECVARVGYVRSGFHPVVIVMDGDYDWVLCTSCAAPVLRLNR